MEILKSLYYVNTDVNDLTCSRFPSTDQTQQCLLFQDNTSTYEESWKHGQCQARPEIVVAPFVNGGNCCVDCRVFIGAVHTKRRVANTRVKHTNRGGCGTEDPYYWTWSKEVRGTEYCNRLNWLVITTAYSQYNYIYIVLGH